MGALAHAKINLRLVVLAEETSGYHQIETIFCRIALADELSIATAGDAGLTLDVRDADVGPVDDNLVMRAARAWFEAAGIAAHHAITLRKRVPAGAGLGGGSSDAAAALSLLDRMHDQILGPDRLLEIAASLGSDVPFFMVDAPLALAWGRGERILTQPGPDAAPAVVVVPATAVREQGGGTHVWVINNNTLEQRPVTVGTTDPSRGIAGIISGLEPGEQVLIAPGTARAGAQVRISGVPAASPAEAEAAPEDESNE